MSEVNEAAPASSEAKETVVEKTETVENTNESTNETESKETPQVEAKAEKPKQDKVSAAFAKLTRKERELIEKEKTLKQKEEKLSALELLEKRMEENFLEVAEERGWDYERITQQVLNSTSKDPSVIALEKEIKAMKEKEQKETDAKTRQAHEASLNSWKDEAKGLISSQAEKFELCSLLDPDYALNTAMNITEAYYQETLKKNGKGEVLPTEIALEWTEEHLEKEASKLSKAKKLEKYRQSVQAGNEVKKTNDEVIKSSKTLSNSMDSDSPSEGFKKMTPAEKRQEALKILKTMRS